MIGRLLWLIYLLTYSDTKHGLLGSRRLFGVSGLCNKHEFQRQRRILVENLYFRKSCKKTVTTARHSSSIESI